MAESTEIFCFSDTAIIPKVVVMILHDLSTLNRSHHALMTMASGID
jgi:hypothetical protein